MSQAKDILAHQEESRPRRSRPGQTDSLPDQSTLQSSSLKEILVHVLGVLEFRPNSIFINTPFSRSCIQKNDGALCLAASLSIEEVQLFDAWKATVKRAYQIGAVARDTSSFVSLCAKIELSRIPSLQNAMSSTNPLHDLDPEIEITLCKLRKARNIVVNNSNSSNSVSNSNNSSPITNNFDSFEYSSTNNFVELEQMENNDQTLKELAIPNVVYQPWCIQYPQLELAQTYELKSGLIHLLPKFHGLAGEDPHKHLKEFHVVYSTMRLQGIPKDYIKMKAFPFSLDGAAKNWLYL
ncbi:hypothetical protein CR513_56172, partial [Mucuna pruriens]